MQQALKTIHIVDESQDFICNQGENGSLALALRVNSRFERQSGFPRESRIFGGSQFGFWAGITVISRFGRELGFPRKSSWGERVSSDLGQVCQAIHVLEETPVFSCRQY